MAEPLSDEIVNQLINNPAFSQYLNWVLQQIDELNSITGLAEMRNRDAGEEVRVRAKAWSKLQEIVEPFLEYRPKREPTLEEFKKAQASYGLQ
jgi:hypothetical protein